VLKDIKDISRDYFKAINLQQSDSDILSFKIIMKLSSVISFSAVFASALAFPTYGNVNARQTWQPRNWTAPGPNDG
jgi:hypothetical protein